MKDESPKTDQQEPSKTDLKDAKLAVIKVVEITGVSRPELEIGGDPVFLYIKGSGFEHFKPKHPNDQPAGKLKAYILKYNSDIDEDKEFIEVVQPTSTAINGDIFPIEVTVFIGADPGARKIGIRNKAEKFKDCGSSTTCFVTSTPMVTTK